MNETVVALGVNAILMLIIIPIGIWMVKTLLKFTKELADMRQDWHELRTVLLGLEGQGGLNRIVEQMWARVRSLESLEATVLADHQEIERIRAWKHPTMTDWQASVSLRLGLVEQQLEELHGTKAPRRRAGEA